jgi:hypothetical protein
MKYEPVVAILGLGGWYERGRSGPDCTYSRGPLQESELSAPIRVHLIDLIESRIDDWFSLPMLDLRLPDDNVRHTFEGCIGYEGSEDGHVWDGVEDVSVCFVGLNVYLAAVITAGGEVRIVST